MLDREGVIQVRRKRAGVDKSGFIAVRIACCKDYHAATLSYVVDICEEMCASGR